MVGLGIGLSARRASTGGSGSDPYAINGVSPEFVFRPQDDVYRLGGGAVAASDMMSVSNGISVAPMFVNSSGVLTDRSNGDLRTDHHVYNSTTGLFERAGCVIESYSTTNLVAGGQGVTSDAWSPINTTRTTLSTDGPRGANTMTRFAETTATGLHGVSNSLGKFSTVNGTDYTISFPVKKFGTRRYIQVTMAAFGFTNTQYATFDLDTVTVSGSSGATGRIRRFSSDVFWITYTVTSNSTGSNGEVVVMSATSPTGRISSFAGSTSNGFYMDIPQVETGPYETFPVMTTTAARTRSADVVSVAAADIPYSASGVSSVLKGTMTGPTTELFNWELNSANNILIRAVSNNFFFRQEASSVVDSVNAGSFTTGYDAPFNVAMRNGPTYVNGASDGTAATENTTPTTLADLSAANMEVVPTATGPIILSNMTLFGADIGNAGLVEGTA